MLKINIIPQSLKDDIKLRQIYYEIKNLLFIILFFIVFYCIVLLVCEIILQIYFIKTVEDTTLITKNTENYSKNTRSINKQMNSAAKIQFESANWTKLFAYLTANTPDGIKFTKINISRQNNSIAMAGIAGTRDKLIELKDFFEKSQFFTKVNFPVKNILEKSNINFDISATIKSYEF